MVSMVRSEAKAASISSFRSVIREAGSSPSQPLVLFFLLILFGGRAEASSDSLDGDEGPELSREPLEHVPVVTTLGISGGRTDSNRLRNRTMADTQYVR